MKRFLYYILCCLSLAACSTDQNLDLGAEGDGQILIATSIDDVVMRSGHTPSESRVEWIDVFIFDANQRKAHSERVDMRSNPHFGGGTLTISKSRSSFAQGAEYSIYLIANSREDLQSKQVEGLDDLKALYQQDENIHLSGFRNARGEMIEADAPALFLMDGVAYGSSDPARSAIKLNDSVNNANLKLQATLRRAAAKILINIKQGRDVEFHHYLELTNEDGNVADIGTAEYLFYHLPISTTLLSSATPLVNPVKQSTESEHDNEHSFVWSKSADHTDAMPNHNIQLIGYTYAYEWDTSEKMVSLVVNLPMRWNESGSEDYSSREGWSSRTQNWYRIPMTEKSRFERNKLYEVNITVNTTGAASKSSAIILDDVEFETYEWVGREITIGEEADEPKFLMLNRDTVHIYNANRDTQQLSFASSSYIPSSGVKVKSISEGGRTKKAIYFYNKFGQKTYLEDINSSAANAVVASAQANTLNGGITISSPIFDEKNPDNESHFNTIRYIEFQVENADGLATEFLVMQYPVIYITNQPGYYSYRDDFIASNGSVVNFENRVAGYVTAAYWGSYKIQRRSGNSWSDVPGASGYDAVQYDQSSTYYYKGNALSSSGGYNSGYNSSYYYQYTEGGETLRKVFSGLDRVFDADVIVKTYTTDSNIGKADLDSYSINRNRDGWSYSNSKDPGNQRMYHVHVTATSSDYTVGRPRIVDAEGNPTNDVENGQTDDSADNARLVSPSFMIASQLGVTQSVNSLSASNYARAVNQCKNYVETYFDDLNNNNKWDSGEPVHHYKDWRLPTAEEIRIISELQGKANGAVDVVLAGRYYYCASPQMYVAGAKNYESDGYFIRCIRDAY